MFLDPDMGYEHVIPQLLKKIFKADKKKNQSIVKLRFKDLAKKHELSAILTML